MLFFYFDNLPFKIQVKINTMCWLGNVKSAHEKLKSCIEIYVFFSIRKYEVAEKICCFFGRLRWMNVTLHWIERGVKSGALFIEESCGYCDTRINKTNMTPRSHSSWIDDRCCKAQSRGIFILTLLYRLKFKSIPLHNGELPVLRKILLPKNINYLSKMQALEKNNFWTQDNAWFHEFIT